jgi:hypothetical protein
MGKGKAVLDQGKNGGEYGSGRKVKKPETPEDEKGEKSHLKIQPFFRISLARKG